LPLTQRSLEHRARQLCLTPALRSPSQPCPVIREAGHRYLTFAADGKREGAGGRPPGAPGLGIVADLVCCLGGPRPSGSGPRQRLPKVSTTARRMAWPYVLLRPSWKGRLPGMKARLRPAAKPRPRVHLSPGHDFAECLATHLQMMAMQLSLHQLVIPILLGRAGARQASVVIAWGMRGTSRYRPEPDGARHLPGLCHHQSKG